MNIFTHYLLVCLCLITNTATANENCADPDVENALKEMAQQIGFPNKTLLSYYINFQKGNGKIRDDLRDSSKEIAAELTNNQKNYFVVDAKPIQNDDQNFCQAIIIFKASGLPIQQTAKVIYFLERRLGDVLFVKIVSISF